MNIPLSPSWLALRFELSRGGNDSNVRPMEGMRGLAVFLVFLVHYVTLVKPWISGASSVHSIADALHTIGNTGVDLFFVLSGYLIYGSLIARKQPFLRFMFRRIERLYPTFIAVLAVYIFLSFVFPAENKIPGDLYDGGLYILQNVLLLPGLFPIEPIITVAWSLSYEMFYYLAIPWIIAVFHLRNRNATWRIIFFALIGLCIFAYCAMNGGHVRLAMFIAGILLYEVLNRNDIHAPPSGVALLALALGLLGMLVPIYGSFGSALKIGILFVTFFILCLTCFHGSGGWLAKWFSWTPIRWLGNMSYSYYLLHGLALKASFLLLGKILPAASYGAWFFWLLMIPMFIATLIASAILFLLIERPLSLAPRKSNNNIEKQPLPIAN